MTVQAYRADDDLSRVESAGLGASQRSLARIRTGFARVLQSRGAVQFSAQSEMLNHLAPVLAKTMALGHLMGQRRSRLMARAAGVGTSNLALDRFSEVMRMVRKAGLGKDLTKLQRGYARRVYDNLREMGANVDAKTRATIATLIAEGEPPGRAMAILQATLDKLGVGSIGQSRLETLYRTEAAVAYQAGRWQEDQEDSDVWGYRYVTMHDDRVRPEHAALDGTVLPKDTDFWRRYWPPNGWNCRCQIETLYNVKGKKHKIKQPGKIEGKIPLPDEGFRKNFGAMEPLAVE